MLTTVRSRCRETACRPETERSRCRETACRPETERSRAGYAPPAAYRTGMTATVSELHPLRRSPFLRGAHQRHALRLADRTPRERLSADLRAALLAVAAAPQTETDAVNVVVDFGLRSRYGLSATELAAQLGISRTTASRRLDGLAARLLLTSHRPRSDWSRGAAFTLTPGVEQAQTLSTGLAPTVFADLALQTAWRAKLLLADRPQNRQWHAGRLLHMLDRHPDRAMQDVADEAFRYMPRVQRPWPHTATLFMGLVDLYRQNPGRAERTLVALNRCEDVRGRLRSDIAAAHPNADSGLREWLVSCRLA
jgi:hypothetical protein